MELTRLRGLKIDRVAFVPEGDDPLARITLWKARRDAEAKGGSMKTEPEWAREIIERAEAEKVAKAEGSSKRDAEALFHAEARRMFPLLTQELADASFIVTERGRALWAAVRAAPPDAAARPAGSTGSVTTSVGKGAAAAAALEQLVEKNLDRRPLDERGRARTREMALVEVVASPRGREVRKALEAEGRAGDRAFRKQFAMDSVEAAKPAPTRGEERLEAIAKSHAKEHELTREQALAELLQTPEGRAAYAEHRRELAAR